MFALRPNRTFFFSRSSYLARGMLFLLLGLNLGCSLTPTYVRPELDLPVAWENGLTPPTERSAALDTAWWEKFEDPELTALVRRALKQNFDLAAASALVESMAAEVGVTRSAEFPNIGVAGSFSRGERSSTGIIPSRTGVIEEYGLSAPLSWELDVWGKLSGQTEAARAALLAEEGVRRGVVVGVVAAVAEAYFELRSLDHQLTIAQQTLTTRKGAQEIAKSRFDAGVAAELELRQADAEVAEAEVTIPQIAEQVKLAELRLRALVGGGHEPIRRGKGIAVLAAVSPLEPGIPSAVLVERPDIVAAEQRLIAANARIGVARAQFLPGVSLTGSFGYASAELDSLIGRGSRVWSVSPGIDLPLFNAGRLRNGLRVSEAEKERLVAQYRGTIVKAIEEIEGSLATFRSLREQVQARENQVAVLQRYLDLANLNYKEGQTSYLAVLDAERRHFDSELGLARARSNLLRALVRGYRALGGRWVDVAAEQTVAPQMEPAFP